MDEFTVGDIAKVALETEKMVLALREALTVLTEVVEEQQTRQEAQSRLLEEIASDARLWRAQRQLRR